MNKVKYTNKKYDKKQFLSNLMIGLNGTTLPCYREGVFIEISQEEKSIFLQESLVPECIQQNWHPIYINLNLNDANPADIISSKLASEISCSLLNSKITNKSIKLNRFIIENETLSSPRLPSNMTISDALQVLHEITDTLIILIIDEISHILLTEAARSIMFSLKSARDFLTISKNGVRMVFADSDRDKLIYLTHSQQQAFYCTSLITFS